MTELAHAAHHAWLEQPAAERTYPFDDVGVLLPLCLETLFDAPQSRHNDDPARWKLSLRVIPDEASICRDNAHISAGELGALQSFWQAARQPGRVRPGLARRRCGRRRLGHVLPASDAAARGLAGRQPAAADRWRRTARRAAADMPPTPQRQPRRRASAAAPCLGRHPRRQWRMTRHPIGRLPMNEGATISAEALPLALPDTPENTRDAWWTSWETAESRRVGRRMVARQRPGARHAGGDLRDRNGRGAADAHFRAQSDAGELGVLRLGAPTNTVHGAPAADLATDTESWRLVAKTRIQQRRTRTRTRHRRAAATSRAT